MLLREKNPYAISKIKNLTSGMALHNFDLSIQKAEEDEPLNSRLH